VILEPVTGVLLHCSRCNTTFAHDESDGDVCFGDLAGVEKVFPPGMKDDACGWIRIGDRVLCWDCWECTPGGERVELLPLLAIDAAKVAREQQGYNCAAAADLEASRAGAYQAGGDEL
jgi:hypothetical protein